MSESTIHDASTLHYVIGHAVPACGAIVIALFMLRAVRAKHTAPLNVGRALVLLSLSGVLIEGIWSAVEHVGATPQVRTHLALYGSFGLAGLAWCRHPPWAYLAMMCAFANASILWIDHGMRQTNAHRTLHVLLGVQSAVCAWCAQLTSDVSRALFWGLVLAHGMTLGGIALYHANALDDDDDMVAPNIGCIHAMVGALLVLYPWCARQGARRHSSYEGVEVEVEVVPTRNAINDGRPVIVP